jgi:hypothetical protein
MQPVDPDGLPSGFQHARELLVERDLLLHGLGQPDDLFHGRPTHRVRSRSRQRRDRHSYACIRLRSNIGREKSGVKETAPERSTCAGMARFTLCQNKSGRAYRGTVR